MNINQYINQPIIKTNDDVLQNLTNIDDIDLQIIRQTENVYALCQTNKRLYKLCMEHQDIKNLYVKQQQIDKRIQKLFHYLDT
jgi:predicted restriction endonuclease